MYTSFQKVLKSSPLLFIIEGLIMCEKLLDEVELCLFEWLHTKLMYGWPGFNLSHKLPFFTYNLWCNKKQSGKKTKFDVNGTPNCYYNTLVSPARFWLAISMQLILACCVSLTSYLRTIIFLYVGLTSYLQTIGLYMQKWRHLIHCPAVWSVLSWRSSAQEYA